jgi:polyhydroxybutyrate depolymerase
MRARRQKIFSTLCAYSGLGIALGPAACDARPARPADTSPSAALPATAPVSAPNPPVADAAAVAAQPPRVAPDAIHVPSTLTDKGPLVIFLHGLGSSGPGLVNALGVAKLAADRKFAWAAPDGAMSSKGQRFWNASKACCDFDLVPIDHVQELRALVAAAASHPRVDPKRIYVIGLSNGGFMAHRLACEVDGIAAIASLAGAGPADGETCTPRHPVAVLEMHGDHDETIRYEGGHALSRQSLPAHPSARATVAGWAQRNGCKKGPKLAGSLDLDDRLEGAETEVLRYAGCERAVELWTVHGGNHFVGTGRKAEEAVLGFLELQKLP